MTNPLLSITSDYASLLSPHHTPLGLYILPSPTDPFTWQGTLFLHRGLYAGLILHFSLLFPTNYPLEGPRVVLAGPPSPYPFHPLVDPQTGEVELGSGEGTGNRAMVVLHRLKDAFKKEGLERVAEGDVRDKGAFRMNTEDPATFADLAKQSAKLSTSYGALYSRRDLFQFRPQEEEPENSARSRMAVGVQVR